MEVQQGLRVIWVRNVLLDCWKRGNWVQLWIDDRQTRMVPLVKEIETILGGDCLLLIFFSTFYWVLKNKKSDPPPNRKFLGWILELSQLRFSLRWALLSTPSSNSFNGHEDFCTFLSTFFAYGNRNHEYSPKHILGAENIGPIRFYIHKTSTKHISVFPQKISGFFVAQKNIPHWAVLLGFYSHQIFKKKHKKIPSWTHIFAHFRILK